MYVIFPAADVVEESYLALVAQELEVPPPTGLTSVRNTELLPAAPPIYHDTRPEQLRADGYLQGDFFEAAEAYRGLPDLVQSNVTSPGSPFKSKDYPGRVETTLVMATGGGVGTMAADLGIAMVGVGSMRVSIRDLIHPTLNEPLKGQQQVTFKIIKTVSDFSHALSKIHEQYSDDLQSLVEDFRRKNTELRAERPACTNSLFNVWDALLQETESDSTLHADISGVLSRAVSRPLLEKTLHMKIQSRKVFTNRESYENLLAKTEDMLIKSHSDFCLALELHGQQKSPMSSMNLLESHNNYVQQLHAANGMIDQYYHDTLPELLQELDYVYHDVSAVMTESMMQGADMIAMKTAEAARRYDMFRRRVKEINPVTDLNAFIKTLHIPDTVTITTHTYAPPQIRDQAMLEGLPPLNDELVVDRASQNVARIRFDSLRKEAQDLEVQIRQLTDALETLVRIQAKSLESQLYNKANELQEDISGKRFDLRLAQIHLAAVRAQKEMFASKVDSGMPGGVGGGGGGGVAPSSGDYMRERKLSSTSSSGGGSMKNKWVKAFKSIKGGKEQPVEQSRQRNGKDNGSLLPQAMGENAHIFQEYTYKKITPCDVCSQILRGHTRQGLKCKLCRMNIHPDCQDPSLKCQPKSRLLRRQKSASEIEARYFGGGDQGDTDSLYMAGSRRDSLASLQRGMSVDERRLQYANMKSLSMESGQSSTGSDAQLQNQERQRGFGGSYSAATGCSSKVITNTLNIISATDQPKLAQVAMLLMKAKVAGELPSALGHKAVVERLPTAQGVQGDPGGGGGGFAVQTEPPDITSNIPQNRTFQSSS